jgi:hypothetical protein
MTEIMSMFFGPLNKNACFYFFILTILFFIGLILVIFNELYFIITNLNRLNFKMISYGFIVIFNIFIAYFVNRLLYTMCNKTLV